MNEQDTRTQAQQFIDKYEADVTRLFKYTAWLADKGGRDVASDYNGEQGHSSIRFPVYDGTLMSFINEAKKSVFINKNYVYAYTRRKIKTPAQEEAAIKNATIMDGDLFEGVISKYILEGMRKSGLWQDAVERKLFLNVLLRCKELIDFYK